MQIAGAGRRIAVEDLRSVLSESKSLAAILMRYAHVVYLQAVYTALANAEGAVDQRLAHDRVEGDDLHLTHEFISIMLGVRRAGVTAALYELEARGQISKTRGCITVLNRAGLEESAGGFYGAAEDEYARLLGSA